MKVSPVFVRYEFRVFDISSYLSAIIRFVIGFKYNHVAIRYQETVDGTEMDYVVEARSGGIFLSTFQNWLEHRPHKQWLQLSAFEINEYEIASRLGKKYDTLSLFQQLLYRITGIWLGSADDSEENCSEFAAVLLKMKDAHRATPKDVYMYLVAED